MKHIHPEKALTTLGAICIALTAIGYLARIELLKQAIMFWGLLYVLFILYVVIAMSVQLFLVLLRGKKRGDSD